uniref:C13 family peptidase n=1 Tax=uncultured Draconibacterium sp. TaxID=1573823 RepID=UPI003216CB86
MLEIKESKPTLKIGVMLPFSGSYATDWDKALDWAVENVNLAGGVAGCDIQLVRKDLEKNELADAAQTFINDKSIKAVIGPLTSGDVFEVAPLFINAKKPLISPVATSSNISRAFAGKKYFWRLAEPDISQVKTLLLLAKSGGAHSVGLITEASQYGASFEDWFGFFATELGLEVAGMQVMKPGDIMACATSWERLQAKNPDAIVSAITSPEQNAELVKNYRSKGHQTRLLFSDAACLPSLIEKLGPLAENLEGTTLSSDPTSGFDISYKLRYNNYPNAFLSNMYDAVMLLALALEASAGEGEEKLADALIRVVSGQSGECSWQRDEIAESLELIKSGVFPDIKGASGSLDYDDLYFTDVTSSTYGHWRVDAGQFVITDFYTSGGNGRISSTSAAYRTIAREQQQFNTSGTWPVLPVKEGNHAFLMACSSGWNNYRHQADVLHTYQLLKKNGFDDEHIVLIMADDLAFSESNALAGVVRNQPEGKNLYQNVVVDYKLKDISSEDIKNILAGVKTSQTPNVISSGLSENVFIFTSGHGTPNGMELDAGESEVLPPEFWKSVFELMHEKQNYRQVFWAFESCYSGVIGEAIKTPGVMVMTGANPYETSKAHFYDPEIKVWLADKFAYSINNTISKSADDTFYDLYQKCYSYVNGSHVSFYNYQNFGNIYELKLSEFVKR